MHVCISSEVRSEFRAFVPAPQCHVRENWSDAEPNQPTNALQPACVVVAAANASGKMVGRGGAGGLPFTAPMSINRIPLWVFQGDADRSVPVDLVREMMKQLKKLNANLPYTEYHNVDHDVWNRAFEEPELAAWLSSRRRRNRQKAKLALARLPRIIKIVA